MRSLLTELLLLALLTLIHLSSGVENLNSTEIDEKIGRNLNVLERGVQHLFDGTTRFLIFIHRKIITDYYERLGLVPSNHADGLTMSAIFDYLIGFVCLAGFCLFLTILVPVISIIVCCCRMRGRCGRENEPYERSQDKSKRICCTGFLFTLVTIAVMSLVLAFTSNNLLATHLSPSKNDGLLAHSVASVEKMATYRDGVIIDLIKLKEMAINTSGIILDTLEDIPKSSVKFFDKQTNGEMYLQNATKLMSMINVLWKKVEILEDESSDFLLTSAHVKEEIDRIKPDLEEQLKAISRTELINELQIRTNDRIVTYANNLKTFIKDNNLKEKFKEGLIDGKSYLSKQRETVRKSIYSTVETLINETRSGQAKIDSIDIIIARLQKLPLNRTIVALSTPPWTESFQNYEYLRLGTYIGICLLLLTVYVIFVIATVLAWVKGPSDVGEKQSCDAEAASSCLVLAVGLGIVLFSTFMIVITAIFLFGGIAYTEVCRFTQPSLADIDDTPLGRVLDATVSARFLNGTSFDNTSVTQAIRHCKNNSGIYTAMQLESQFHLEQYLSVKNRMEMAGKIFNKIDNATSPIVRDHKIFPTHLINLIEAIEEYNISGSGLDLPDHDSLKAQLNEDQIALKKIYGLLNPDDQVTDTLKKLHRRQFPILISRFNHIEKNITALKEDFEGISAYARKLLQIVKVKDSEIQAGLKENIGMHTMAKMMEIYKYYKTYLNPMKNFIFKDMGKCQLLYASIDQFVNFACTNTIHAFNAYWAAVGVVLLLLLPSFGAAASLVVLFRRTGKGLGFYHENANLVHDYETLHDDTHRWKDTAKRIVSSKDYSQHTPPKVPLLSSNDCKTTIC